MEGFMIARFGAAIYSCTMTVVLFCIIGAVIYIEKRLSHSSWHRNMLALIASIGAGLISLSIIYIISNTFAPENSYFSGDDSSLSLNYFSVFVLEILVSISVGYAAGKIARQNEIVYGFLVGLSMVLFSIGFKSQVIFSFPQFNGLDLTLSCIIKICSTTLGGYIALFQRELNQGQFTDNNEAKSAS
jgi:hypothetical protein